MNCSLSPESTRQHRSAEPGDAVWVYAAQKPCDEVASEAIDSTSSSSYDDVDVSDVGGTLTTESTSSHETPRNMFSSLSKEKQKMVPPKNGRVGSASARQEVDVKTRQEVDVKTRQKVDVKTRQEVDVKTKLACAWNNMKYGWPVKMKTHFKRDSPIWLLGKCYHCSQSEKAATHDGVDPLTIFEQFKHDFTSRIWLTYRHDFGAIAGCGLTSDVGWGCMLRTGQMALAQALTLHLVGRDWRWTEGQPSDAAGRHERVLRLFGDHPSEQSPFSLHTLVRLGRGLGKSPPDWYGPASVAHILREAVNQAADVSTLSRFAVYVAQDCTVYKCDVLRACGLGSGPAGGLGSGPAGGLGSGPAGGLGSGPAGGLGSGPPLSPCGLGSVPACGPAREQWSRAVLLLIPVRLGGEKLNPVYLSCVRAVLSHPLCVGIMGGRPKHSLYFIGWQGDKLLYLDPHFAQPAVDIEAKHFPVDTFHCTSPRKMAADRMDPSCSLAFYCQTRADFDCFINDLQQMTSPPGEHDLYPMFVIDEGSSEEASRRMPSALLEKRLCIVQMDKNGRPRSIKQADEFVLLG